LGLRRPELGYHSEVNALSITIGAGEAQEIEQEAEKSRAKVRELFAAYRSGALGNGNTDRDQDAAISESVREKFANYRPDSGNGG
jgi:hypothetical protein